MGFTADNWINKLQNANAQLQDANKDLTKKLEIVTGEYIKTAKQYATQVQQGKAMGGDPRSGADMRLL